MEGVYVASGTDPEIAFYGRFVRSRRLAEHGLVFRHPSLPGALAACFG